MIPSPIVSSRHAKIEISDGECTIYDLNSTNGILVGNEKVYQKVLQTGDHIRIDHLHDTHNEGIFIIFSMTSEDEEEKWNEVYFKELKKITVGRESSNDIIISQALISRKHAEFYVETNQLIVKDLNSTNGTFVNGTVIKAPTSLKTLDIVYIGQTKFVVQQNKLIYKTPVKGLQIDAISIGKTVVDSAGGFFWQKSTKKILDNISISIKPGELVALIGGSGAGKCTFMDTLNGFRPATEGTVLVNGDDFYANYNAYKNIMGYVPQQDIVYDTLTVEQMFTYAAKLEPEDSTDEDISQRVNEVIGDVELEGRGHLVISQLSGGQRKRVSIAVEWLQIPSYSFWMSLHLD